MVSTNNKTNISGVTNIKTARIKKNLNRLTELVNRSPETKQRTQDYLMAMTNAERQKAYRDKKKDGFKRLDLRIAEQDYLLFNEQSKQSGLTRVEFFNNLLHGKQINTETLNPDPEIIQKANELKTYAKNLEQENLKALKEITHLKNQLESIQSKTTFQAKADLLSQKVLSLKDALKECKNNSKLREKAYNDLSIERNRKIKHLETHHQCQKIKHNGEQCDKKGSLYKVDDAMVYLCGIHSKHLKE